MEQSPLVPDENAISPKEELQIPTVGRIVHYMLSAADAEQVNKRRNDSWDNRARHREDSLGYVVGTGNTVLEGHVFPMMIVKVWGNHPGASVNGQVFLDGNDTLWVTSVAQGPNARQYTWPTRH